MWLKFKNFFKFNYTPEQIKNMTEELYFSVFGVNLFSVIVVVVVLYSHIDLLYLLFWVSSQICVGILRFFVGKKLSQSMEIKKKKLINYYLNSYLIIIAISGLLWGLLICLVINQLDVIYEIFILMMYFALTSGSIVTLGSIFMAIFTFVVFLSIPTVFALIYQGMTDMREYTQVLLILFYVFTILKISYKKHKLSKENALNIDFLKQYESVANKSSIISKTDTLGIITYVNDNFCNISGYSREELVGKNHNIVRHPDVPKSSFTNIWDVIKREKKTWKGVVKNRAKNGDAYYVNATITPILDDEKNIIEYIALKNNISGVMSDKNQLFDYLESNKLSTLIMIQIEDYNILEKFYDKKSVKNIENKFGDVILYLLPETCSFSKVYYLENGLYALVRDRKTCYHSQKVIENMLEVFLKNVKEYVVKFDNIEYDISVVCSFTYGVIQTFEDGKIGIEKAIQDKQSIVYADGLSIMEYTKALKNLEVLHTIKIAIDDNKIVSYFQPIVDNETRKIIKYESLVRLIKANGDIVSPIEFLDIAKKGRYYSKVTKIVLENSFSALMDTDKDISINLSTIDMESIKVQDKIFSLLAKYKDHAQRITFELLESEDSKNIVTIINFIKKVKLLGVQIAIDDFGAGYSNFERLLQYEPDVIKIDGSLIKNIKNNELSKNIVETIVMFAKKQNLKTVAEFVENEAIFDIVKEMGIDYSQGYAFGKAEELF